VVSIKKSNKIFFDIRDKIRKKQDELKQIVSKEVEKYSMEINKYLENFGVNFRIEKLKQTYRGRSTDPYLEYCLALEGHEINAEDTKHCLSEGDKNALALSFFLAKLNLDTQIHNKVVIFDDPVSSFDRNRRTRTVEYIRDLSTKAKQTIVLTHYDIFAFALYDYLKEIGLKSKNLQISEGKIIEWKIDEEMINPYFKKISQLENYISGTLNIDVSALIRDVLEDALKLHYFQHFKNLDDKCWLGSMIEKLRTIKQNDTTFRFKHENTDEVLTELGNLCDFSCPSHHGNINMPHRIDKSPEEIKTYAKSTLKLVYEWL
jgi:wobble nucleotide-excising tRNase